MGGIIKFNEDLSEVSHFYGTYGIIPNGKTLVQGNSGHYYEMFVNPANFEIVRWAKFDQNLNLVAESADVFCPGFDHEEIHSSAVGVIDGEEYLASFTRNGPIFLKTSDLSEVPMFTQVAEDHPFWMTSGECVGIVFYDSYVIFAVRAESNSALGWIVRVNIDGLRNISDIKEVTDVDGNALERWFLQGIAKSSSGKLNVLANTFASPRETNLFFDGVSLGNLTTFSSEFVFSTQLVVEGAPEGGISFSSSDGTVSHEANGEVTIFGVTDLSNVQLTMSYPNPPGDVFAAIETAVHRPSGTTLTLDFSSGQAKHAVLFDDPLVEEDTRRAYGYKVSATTSSAPDTDGDGVADVNDADPNDPFVCQDVDNDGCDDCSQTGADGSGGSTTNDGPDTDGDGICDGGDLDDDNDGVNDVDDLCPETPAGTSVNAQGCPDADGDGIADGDDQCSETPAGEMVNGDGCSDSQLDDDGDGVTNDVDNCDSEVGPAENNGCNIAANAVSIETISEGCPGTNGSIIVSSIVDFAIPFTLVGLTSGNTVSGTLAAHASEYAIGGGGSLQPETYKLTFSLGAWERVYPELMVRASQGLAFRASKSSQNNISITVDSGTAPFSVVLNGAPLPGVFEYNTFEIAGVQGKNTVEVSSVLGCEGKIVKEIVLEGDRFAVYPNPVREHLHLIIPDGFDSASISIYDITGRRMLTSSLSPSIDVGGLASGNYIVVLEANSNVKTTKIIKR